MRFITEEPERSFEDTTTTVALDKRAVSLSCSFEVEEASNNIIDNNYDDEINMKMRDHYTRSPRSPLSFEEEEAAIATAPLPSSKQRPVRIYDNSWFANDCSFEVEETFMITDSINDVNDKYYIDETIIGTGHFGIVRRCMNKATKEWYAIKSIEKCKIQDDEVIHLKREIANLQDLGYHPNIISLIDAIEDEFYLHLITDLCNGGELYDSIVDTVNFKGRFDEHEAAKIIYEALQAIDYCHSKNIVHRDIKPENFMINVSPHATNKSNLSNDDFTLKLIDFGLSTKHYPEDDDKPLDACVGTPYYLAPEVLRKRYDKQCDLWSVGVIAYVLLCGYPPFEGRSNHEMFNKILSREEVRFHVEDWTGVSYEAMDFIYSLLQKNPKERLNTKEAMDHIWIKKQLSLARNSDDENRQ